ncbi:MAG: adenylosuccinate lyase [Flavobacteriaceae bacterium]|nr:adenylosuccinate lyase [Flavobacteriaceae bacterium]
MLLNTLNAISPIDGRYRKKTKSLHPYFSEQGLIKYRVQVEIEYFISLCERPLPQLNTFKKSLYDDLRAIYIHFSAEDAKAIKDIEKTTNHDVKAVEYFIKNEFDRLDLGAYKEFIHFGLTSQDINNTAIPLSIKEALDNVLAPKIEEVKDSLNHLAQQNQQVSMLARTHGQPASPTRLGKEIEVFVVRLDEQLRLLQQIPMAAKFGGATGNFNAHKVAYPDIDWKAFGQKFVEGNLGLKHSFPTTQIEHYDHLAALCDGLKRINTILVDFSRDVWTYISMEYFKQKIKENEVGSSAMPHKVNPIDFENAEGNLGMANAIFEFLASKLPVSRLQRDLTDSTVLRNIGVPMGHTLIGLESILKGIGKLEVNKTAIEQDLEQNWAVVAEAIQTILRREGYKNPYEALKAFTRTHGVIDAKAIKLFIDQLDVTDAVKDELYGISPQNYTGI